MFEVVSQIEISFNGLPPKQVSDVADCISSLGPYIPKHMAMQQFLCVSRMSNENQFID